TAGVFGNLFFSRFSRWRFAIGKQHLRIDEAIAYIDVGKQIGGIGRIVFDLLAQLANEGAQVLDLFAAIGAPDRRQQTRVSNDAAGAAHQAVEDVVLLAREMYGLAAFGDGAPCGRETNL